MFKKMIQSALKWALEDQPAQIEKTELPTALNAPLEEPETSEEPVETAPEKEESSTKKLSKKESKISGAELEELAVNAAQAVRKKMERWKTPQADREAIAKMLPGEGASPQDWSDTILAIQKKYILKQFYQDFERALYNNREDINSLRFHDYVQFQLKAGVLRNQLVQLMAVATQGLINQARATQQAEKQTDLPEEKLEVPDSKPEAETASKPAPEDLPKGEVIYEDPDAAQIPAWLLNKVGQS